MGSILMKKVCDDAATLIQDKTGVRWPTSELLNFGNAGQREIVIHKPEACVKNAARALTAGQTKQTLPADAVTLIKITRNMGSGGSTPGDSIRIVDQEILDSQRPTWHSDANAAGKIQHYVFDPRDPKTYYVYPKAPATAWWIEEVYTAAPAECTINGVDTGVTDSPISVDDIYANTLIDYILYRAYSKDAEYAQNQALAIAYYQAFTNALGVKTANEVARNPNLISGAQGNPNTPRTPGGA